MNECKKITSMFQTLNFAIKSVADLEEVSAFWNEVLSSKISST
jgi:hypothetical protein